jgi:hypothetical protein
MAVTQVKLTYKNKQNISERPQVESSRQRYRNHLKHTTMRAIVLKEADADRMRNLNAKNGWGIRYEDLMKLISQHQKAKAAGDLYKCALIEYRLTDINFHSEVSMLEKGQYEELRQLTKETF